MAIITAGGIHTGHSSNLKAHLTRVVIIHIRRVLKCDSTQDGYTSSLLLLTMAVHKLLAILINNQCDYFDKKRCGYKNVFPLKRVFGEKGE